GLCSLRRERKPMNRTCMAGAAALALLVTSAASAVPPLEALMQRQKAEKRIAQVEERLQALPPESRKAEIRGARDRTMLGLPRRLLTADNLPAAQLQLDLAERFTAIAEGKAVQK